MTQDDIMKLARKAGLYTHKNVQPEILAFANLVAAAKAEECAKVAEQFEPDEKTSYGRRTNMSRLLHAAARGARIEALYQRCWIPLTHISLEPNAHAYRIHPDDAHLQYGPISTALREMAADDSWNPSLYRVLAISAATAFRVYSGGVREDYPLFHLFLAEFLADEGM